MPKKKKKPQIHALKRVPRLRKARQWLAAYTGSQRHIVRNYRSKFKVDIPTAIRDLQEIGHVFTSEYVEAALRSEEQRLRQKALKKQEQSEFYNEGRNDRFYFIAGYTSGGAPYGVTWEEMGMEPYEDELGLIDDDDNDSDD